MFPHPEDLYRSQQLRHAETIRNHTLERQARAAARPPHRLREITLRIGGFVLSRRWWKGIAALFTRRRSAGSAPSQPHRATVPPGSSTKALTGAAPDSIRR